jgi:regulator of RNase E activity RraA
VRGRVIDYRCPIRFGNGAIVNPGDILFGDRDGVVAIPKEISQEIVQAALEKVEGENLVAKAIREGMSTVEAWNRFGIM